MASLKIPVDSNDSNYFFTTDIEGVVYRFRMMYNQRSLKWYLSVESLEGDEILSGVPVLSDTELLTAVKERLPELPLYAINVNIK